jgi:hypothetical protein
MWVEARVWKRAGGRGGREEVAQECKGGRGSFFSISFRIPNFRF